MRRVLVLVALFLAAAPSAAASDAVRADVADLLADPAAFTPPAVEEVVVRGELVGDFGRRREAVWTQLNGDAYADRPLLGGGGLAGANLGVGVRIPIGLWEDLGEPGGYRHRGAIVDLTGVWRYHDPGRGGESYLDVTALDVVAPELPLDEAEEWLALGIGLALLAAAAGVVLRFRPFRRD